MNGLSAVQFDSFFELYTNTRTRGHTLKLNIKSFHTELRQHFFSERIINLWNSLDKETVTASSLNSFKNNLVRLRKHNAMKIGHVLGKRCLWTYEAEPAPSGNASFGELSVSRNDRRRRFVASVCSTCVTDLSFGAHELLSLSDPGRMYNTAYAGQSL